MESEKCVVLVPRGVAPCHIDDFPADCKRSVKGSLRVTPGVVYMTEDELKHVRKHHKDLARRLQVPPAPRKAAPKAKPAAPKAEEPKAESKAEDKSSGGSGKRGGKSK